MRAPIGASTSSSAMASPSTVAAGVEVSSANSRAVAKTQSSNARPMARRNGIGFILDLQRRPKFPRQRVYYGIPIKRKIRPPRRKLSSGFTLKLGGYQTRLDIRRHHRQA